MCINQILSELTVENRITLLTIENTLFATVPLLSDSALIRTVHHSGAVTVAAYVVFTPGESIHGSILLA